MLYNKTTLLPLLDVKYIRVKYSTKFHENNVTGRIVALTEKHLIFSINDEIERMISYKNIKNIEEFKTKRLVKLYNKLTES